MQSKNFGYFVFACACLLGFGKAVSADVLCERVSLRRDNFKQLRVFPDYDCPRNHSSADRFSRRFSDWELIAIIDANGEITFIDGRDRQSGEKGDPGPIGPQGPKGDKGDPGPQGEVGPPGSPGGEQGPPGPKGDRGDPGPQGPTGPTGPRGLQGIQGPPGPQGLKGERGDTGLQGQIGPIGQTGLQGARGATGAQGPIGPQGPVGPQGPIGVGIPRDCSDGQALLFRNGEWICIDYGSPDLTFHVGDQNNTTWDCVDLDLEEYCGDGDGCSMQLLMQHETDASDAVRTIRYYIFMEQPDLSNVNDHEGINGHADAGQGGGTNFIAGIPIASYRSELFSPWNWLYAFNYRHGNCSGQFGAASLPHENPYQLTFMTNPAVKARVIVFDKP